jgi:hypothetical protein
VDNATKILGPLEHWRKMGWTMGLSEVYLDLLERAERKFGKRKRRTDAAGGCGEQDVSEGESDMEADEEYDTAEAWGSGEKPWEGEWPAEETEEERKEHMQANHYKLEERHDAIVRSCERKERVAESSEGSSAEAGARLTDGGRAALTARNSEANANQQGHQVHAWLRERIAQGAIPESETKRYRDTVLGGAPVEESREQKNVRAADAMMSAWRQEAETDGSPQRKRGREQPLSPVMQTHGDMGERGATRARHRSGARKKMRSKNISDWR